MRAIALAIIWHAIFSIPSADFQAASQGAKNMALWILAGVTVALIYNLIRGK